jgi:hypothetical protein
VSRGKHSPSSKHQAQPFVVQSSHDVFDEHSGDRSSQASVELSASARRQLLRIRDLELAHHSSLGVLEDVAVEHPAAGRADLDGDEDARLAGDVDGVLPGERGDGLRGPTRPA